MNKDSILDPALSGDRIYVLPFLVHHILQSCCMLTWQVAAALTPWTGGHRLAPCKSALAHPITIICLADCRMAIRASWPSRISFAKPASGLDSPGRSWPGAQASRPRRSAGQRPEARAPSTDLAERLVRAAGFEVRVALGEPGPAPDALFERTLRRTPAERLADATRAARFVLRGRRAMAHGSRRRLAR